MADYNIEVVPSGFAPITLGYVMGEFLDTTPPTISLVSPVTLTAGTPIVLNISDDDPGIESVLITIKYKHTPDPIVVYDGAFASSFATSTIVGDVYTIRGTWFGAIERLRVRAHDGDGNVLQTDFAIPYSNGLAQLPTPVAPGAVLERVDHVRKGVGRIYSQFMEGYTEAELTP